ncbi:hypothetical protein MFRU_008g02130 [Monilinia fructicola]|nr:hypothetical protein MFRU_008g02130 [Monilinia fructicola]
MDRGPRADGVSQRKLVVTGAMCKHQVMPATLIHAVADRVTGEVPRYITHTKGLPGSLAFALPGRNGILQRSSHPVELVRHAKERLSAEGLRVPSVEGFYEFSNYTAGWVGGEHEREIATIDR